MKVKGDAPIAWVSLDAARAEAKKSGKPILMMVFADWCPKCRTWGPALHDAELVQLSKKLIMVKLDQERDQAALQPYAKLGGYVPRFFFLDADGSLNPTLTSGHPRFPYFFHSSQIATLKAAIRKAVGG